MWPALACTIISTKTPGGFRLRVFCEFNTWSETKHHSSRLDSHSRLELVAEGLLDENANLVEDFWAVNRHFAEDLAVQRNVGEFQTMNEEGVPQTSHAGRSSQASNPQLTEITLTHATVAEGVATIATDQFLN